jgi:fructoselysine 6-phosphate deglycase
MAEPIDRQAMIATLDGAVGMLDAAMTLGRSLGPQIDRVLFVAHGSANRAMLGFEYWIGHFSPSLEVRRYFPSELMAQAPPRLDARTLVVIASKSGTTAETVAAAEWLAATPCRTVGFTLRPESPLAGKVQTCFAIGPTEESFIGLFMVMQALVGGLLAARDGWELADKLLESLKALPSAAADAATGNEARAAAEARDWQDVRVLYEIAAGPVFTTAYVWGVCIVMEMLRLHSTPLEAAEFFHGPFEVVDRETPLVLLLGEDPSRPLMERVVRFCDKHAGRVITYDSRNFAMPGIDPAIRGIVAPYILQAAVKRISAHLSTLLGRPLDARRYMWKGGY